MRRLAVALLLASCTPPPAPMPTVREPAPAATPPVAPTPTTTTPPAPRFAVLTYPTAPCLGPPNIHAKQPRPVGPTISCEDANRQRDAWLAATAAIADPAKFPRTLPEGSPRLGTHLDITPTAPGTRLVTEGPAGTLVVELAADGGVQYVVHGAIERPFPTRTGHMYLAVKLPADLAPPMYRIYDFIGPTGQVEARLTGGVWVTSWVARGYAPPEVDQAKIDEWIRSQLPPVRGPTLTLTSGQSALYDAAQSKWRVWSPPAAETDPEDEGSLLDLGAAGVAFAAEPTRDACLARWFGPGDEVGKTACRIVALPGGGARFTRTTGAGVELVDIDARGGEQVRVTLEKTDGLAVRPVPSPAQEVAWEQKGRLTVQTADGERRVKAGVPTCRGRAPFCSVDYARAVGQSDVLVEELRGPDEAHPHIAGLAGPRLARSACDVVETVHREADSQALLRCDDTWTLRTWTVADGREADSQPDAARIAEHEAPRPANTLEIAGERVCAVGGWAHQGAACTGLQRYNAKTGAYEPAP